MFKYATYPVFSLSDLVYTILLDARTLVHLPLHLVLNQLGIVYRLRL